MKIALIAAVAENKVIGKDNDLLWRLPVDMKFFREKTSGHHILTGRKNYESIPEKFRPLPNRVNLIVTKNAAYQADGAKVFHSIEEAIQFAKENKEEELFVIGGGEIYQQTIQQADVLYITEVHHHFEGDAWFPEIDQQLWQLVNQKTFQADEKNPYNLSFCEYIKRADVR